MSDQRLKTLRHIETVRNYINTVIAELLRRQELHDQSKFDEEECKYYDGITTELRTVTFGSPEYFQRLEQIRPALDHHYANNRHHPEHHDRGIAGMNLVDIIEMIVDWKSSSLRHDDGNIYRSIEINQGRFGYSDELRQVLINTAEWLDKQNTYHHANES